MSGAYIVYTARTSDMMRGVDRPVIFLGVVSGLYNAPTLWDTPGIPPDKDINFSIYVEISTKPIYVPL